MRRRLLTFAIAGALLGLSGAAHPAAVQGDELGRLEGELQDIEARLVDADALLQRIDTGGVYLVTNGMTVGIVTQEQLAQWATDQLYREGTGIGGGRDQEFVFRRVQQAVAGSPRLTASLREVRREDATRREVVRRELARLRGATADANRAAAVTSNCSLPRSWRIDMAGRGSTNVTADASGSVSGGGITTGRATLAGSQLTIQWFSRGGGYEVGGRYIVALDPACNGAGELVLDIVPAGASEFGIRGGPVTFTSLGVGPS